MTPNQSVDQREGTADHVVDQDQGVADQAPSNKMVSSCFVYIEHVQSVPQKKILVTFRKKDYLVRDFC